MKSKNLLIIATIFCLFTQCGLFDPNEPVTINGLSKEYTINSTEANFVEDDISGLSFFLPQGGNGKLKITNVLVAPKIPIDAKKFTISYSGTTPLEVKVPNTENEIGVLFFFGTPKNASINGDTKEAWWQLPQNIESGDSIIYSLSAPSDSLKSVKVETPEVNTYAYSLLKKDSPFWQQRSSLIESLNDVITTWADFLPEDLASKVKTGRKKEFKYTVNITFNEGSSYQAFKNNWIYNNCVFYFDLGDGESKTQMRTIAHEVGHYMSHIVWGYENYNEILSKFPSDFLGSQLVHGPAFVWERDAGTLEDFAYLSEYLIMGYVDQDRDFSNVDINNFNMMLEKDIYPYNVDYPGIEGMSAVMLISLLRKEDKIYCFEKEKWGKVQVPIVNATQKEVVTIFVKHPADVNETKNLIQAFFESKGSNYANMLSPVIEPLGWSYNAMGTIVDTSGVPLSKAKIQAIYKVNDKEYRTIESAQTGSDGVFYLQRVFPETTILRIFFNNDSLDYKIPVETFKYENPTNETIHLEQLIYTKTDTTNNSTALPTQLNGSLFNLITNLLNTEMKYMNDLGDDYPYTQANTVTTSISFVPADIAAEKIGTVKWSGNTFSLSFSVPHDAYYGLDRNWTLTGTLSADFNTLENFNYKKNDYIKVEGIDGTSTFVREIRKDTEFSIENVAKVDFIDDKAYKFRITGTDLEKYKYNYNYFESWITKTKYASGDIQTEIETDSLTSYNSTKSTEFEIILK